jgi:hypothetical protein
MGPRGESQHAENELGLLQDRVVRKFFMGFQSEPVDPIQEPVQLATRHGDNRLTFRGPREACLLETLQPQRKPRPIPVQQLQAISLPVREREDPRRKGIEPVLLLDQDRQPVDGLAKVDRSSTQQDFDIRVGAHHERTPTSSRSASPRGTSLHSSSAPLPRRTRSEARTRLASGSSTRTNWGDEFVRSGSLGLPISYPRRWVRRHKGAGDTRDRISGSTGLSRGAV